MGHYFRVQHVQNRPSRLLLACHGRGFLRPAPQVIIRHKTLGIMHKCFMLAIFLYVIVYTIIYQKARAKHKICGCPHVLAPGIGRGSRLARFISCVQKYNVSELPQGTVSLSILPAGNDNLASPDATLNYVSNKPYCQQPPADAFTGSSRSTICSSLRRETVVASLLSFDSIVLPCATRDCDCLLPRSRRTWPQPQILSTMFSATRRKRS